MAAKYGKMAAMVTALLAVLGVSTARAQQNLPPTIDVPVTFYDFHSDRSNPEFEQPHTGMRRIGMVGDQLDADNKPVRGNSPYLNYGIAHWFRDWSTYMTGPYSRGTNMAPVYMITIAGGVDRPQPNKNTPTPGWTGDPIFNNFGYTEWAANV